ncbi:MAG: glycosyltransferase [Reyranella sp.]|uniref:glycosyltransferase family 2 protein n=1 Tax=Reyranella sp. TaxID=1929291 RepID=UPI00272F7239|nr:glycosyltransferase [Reyranella sp.]MDP1963460.1 glycosyltransferase [Reyranella sp.]MDP2376928.1 glycosyltransferase [Reyranella sp.]
MPIVPSVGVVIANFNSAPYVAAAIESAASQTIRDICVVVVDDASTDGSDEIIRNVLSRLNDPRFHYVRLGSNVGQAGAIRRGLAELKTPFVCFLDSDDYWYPEFVAQHLTAHLNADFPVALSFCDSHIVDVNGRMLAATAWWFDFNDGKPGNRLIDPAMIPDIRSATGEVTYSGKRPMILRTEWTPDSATNTTASMMLRRNFVDLVLVPPDRLLTLYVDYYLSTFAALLTGVVAIHDSLYAYRMHGANCHSNGEVLGGPYNSSTADWSAIRTRILQLIRTTLRDEAPSIRQAFGDYQYNLAERLLTDVLEPRSWPMKARDRLRRLFR